jgi:hypothetical protein
VAADTAAKQSFSTLRRMAIRCVGVSGSEADVS